MGQDFYNAFIAAHARGVKIRLVINEPSADNPDNDTKALAAAGVIEARYLNWTNIYASGILHTKLFVVDDQRISLCKNNRALTLCRPLRWQRKCRLAFACTSEGARRHSAELRHCCEGSEESV